MDVIYELNTNSTDTDTTPETLQCLYTQDFPEDALGKPKTRVVKGPANPSLPKLGTCQECKGKEAVYTCPRCLLRTCSLDCVKSHKETTGCDGIRDKTAYKAMSQFSDLDLLSDYRLLEEVGRSVDAYHRDKTRTITRQGKDLPVHLHKLRVAASKRGTRLNFLPQNFSKHRSNTTILNFKTNVINWRILWKFPQADFEFVDERIPEDTILSNALEKFLEPGQGEEELSRKLQFYQSAGYSAIRLFLPIEWEPGQSGNYDVLEQGETFQENLKGKVLTEHPTIYVVLQDHAHLYPLRKDTTNEEMVAKKMKMTYYEASEGEITDSETEQGSQKSLDLKQPEKKPKKSSSWSIPEYKDL